MVKAIAIVGLLSLAVAFNANAHDSDRISQLEKELQETKLRLSKLESLLSSPSKTQELVVPGEGWKSVTNWRKLITNMDPSDVRKILGEPAQLDGGMLSQWRYQNGGAVFFYNDKVDRWQEPRR